MKYLLPFPQVYLCRDDTLLTVISHVSFRPLTVSTEEYGKMWLDFSNDTKQNLSLISDGQESLTATLNVLKKKLQLHVVEIIGERIFYCWTKMSKKEMLLSHEKIIQI